MLFEPQPPRFFADELLDGLERLAPSRRAACLFALESGLAPDFVTELTWRRLQVQSLPPLALEVLLTAQRVRHIRLPYVFWEWATDKIAAPLLRFRGDVEQAFDCEWEDLRKKYQSMVFIDRKADARHFLALRQEV